jgi:GH24 family phage-related lysozyme (muramidase)
MHPGARMTNPAPITFEQLFRYYRGLPHQMAAIQMLEADIRDNGYKVAMRRDRPWFKVWSQDGKQVDLAAALKLIQQFEGCHLDAYPDPLSGGEPWTIGWGTTRYSDGRRVQKGDKINRVEADELLQQEVNRIAEQLRSTVPHWSAMADHQKCALISFAYNLGSGFYGAKGFETISKHLRDKDWAKVPETMLLYRNPGTKVEVGLRRRREAEGRVWLGASSTPPVQQQPAKLSPNSPFSARLTPHIRIGEFCLDQEARRFEHQHQVDTAAELAAFLERVRQVFSGKPVVITSGFRPVAINRLVGGASGSEHLYDAPDVGAVDFYIDGASINAVQDWCDKNWPFSLGYGAPKGFVHLGIRRGRPRVRWDY